MVSDLTISTFTPLQPEISRERSIQPQMRYSVVLSKSGKLEMRTMLNFGSLTGT